MTLKDRLAKKKERLDLYYAAEEAIIGGAQSYSLGTRSLTRGNLADIRAMIDSLEKDVNELEDRIKGKRPRKAFGVVPRDF